MQKIQENFYGANKQFNHISILITGKEKEVMDIEVK